MALVTNQVPVAHAFRAVFGLTRGVAVIVADGPYARAICLADARDASLVSDRVMGMDPAADWRAFAAEAEREPARPLIPWRRAGRRCSSPRPCRNPGWTSTARSTGFRSRFEGGRAFGGAG